MNNKKGGQIKLVQMLLDRLLKKNTAIMIK